LTAVNSGRFGGVDGRLKSGKYGGIPTIREAVLKIQKGR